MSDLSISQDEMTLMENAIVAARQYLEADESQQAQVIKQQLVEAEQVASAKLDTSEGTIGPGAMGGSAVSKDEKIKDLLQSFGLAKRI